MALPIGTVLDGKFKVVQILGEGGMGTVYKVEQLGTPPGTAPYYYAVKELLIDPHTSEEERKTAIERFNKEIALLRGLKHPRIAAFSVSFQEKGRHYFVMEFVPGRTLEQMLEDAKGPLPLDQVVGWMMQVCEALTYIHTLNPPIILRDLKPGNIMVTNKNDVQLIDFGIARQYNPSKRTNTENLGTISYASPEHLGSITAPGQRRSAQNPGKLVQTDARSDIYSLGATMYHVLTNYEPDPIQTPFVSSIVAKNPRVNTITEQVIIKAMQQDPAKRFQNAEAMRVALLQCLPNQVAPTTIQIPAMSSPHATIIVNTNGSAPASVQGVICPKCGFPNRPGAKFCKRDGQPLVRGIAIASPQRSIVARPVIQTRPAQSAPPPQPIRARPVQQAQSVPPSQPIRARPVQSVPSNALPVRSQPIRARPVQPARTPSVGSNGNVSDPQAAYREGLQLLTSKKFSEAIDRFKLVQSQGNASYEVLYNLGRAYRQYGQSIRDSDRKLFSQNMILAAEYFEEALTVKKEAPDSAFQLGLCYRDLDLPVRATNAFKKAQALTPQDSAIYYQLGLVALELGAYREAEAHLKEGLKINPDHVLIMIALGQLYIKTKQIPTAIKILREATQRDPAIWEGWYQLGRAHMKQREWSYALSALERARQVNAAVSGIFAAMAVCFLKLNKKAEARQMVNEALQLDPKNPEVLRLQNQL
jgi:serine/threonine protein kinase/Tfp pilus assembly protein PilF